MNSIAGGKIDDSMGERSVYTATIVDWKNFLLKDQFLGVAGSSGPSYANSSGSISKYSEPPSFIGTDVPGMREYLSGSTIWLSSSFQISAWDTCSVASQEWY